jgi:hypothetical protein
MRFKSSLFQLSPAYTEAVNAGFTLVMLLSLVTTQYHIANFAVFNALTINILSKPASSSRFPITAYGRGFATRSGG